MGIKESLGYIGEVYKVITNPIIIWEFIVKISFWVACIGGVIAILIYVCGFEKSLRYVWLAVLLYAVIQGINGVI